MKSSNTKSDQLKPTAKTTTKKKSLKKLTALAEAGNVKAQKKLAKMKKAAKAKKKLADAEVEKQRAAVTELATLPAPKSGLAVLRNSLGLSPAPKPTALEIKKPAVTAKSFIDDEDLLDDEDNDNTTSTSKAPAKAAVVTDEPAVSTTEVEASAKPVFVDLHPWPFEKTRKGVILRKNWNSLVEEIQNTAHTDSYAECENLHQTIAELLDSNDALRERLAEMQEHVNKFTRGFDAAFN